MAVFPYMEVVMAGADATIIPGQGWVLLADVDAEGVDLAKFNPSDEGTFGVWTSLGHTSADNTVALSKEGGEVTVRNSWDTPALRSEMSAVSWGATVNALDFNKETLTLAFPNGQWDEATKSLGFSGHTGSINKSVFIVMKDTVNGFAGIHFPNASINIGEAPSIATDAFFEVQLQITALASPTTGENIRFYPPVANEAATEEPDIPEPEAA